MKLILKENGHVILFILSKKNEIVAGTKIRQPEYLI